MRKIALFKRNIIKHDILILGLLASIFSTVAIIYCFLHGSILNYGDAESHINIAKRVVDSLTPGLAQLGGIWLPLPHLLMVPFVILNPLWRTGLGGSIVGGITYIISALFMYKIVVLITGKRLPALIAFFVFSLNPNILYLQSTPMSELPLLAFFILSVYYYMVFIKDPKKLLALIFAAFFGFCATLSRYDGWFLVAFEAVGMLIYYVPKKELWKSFEGKFILFGTLGFFGIALWFLWDFLILGDPMYFSDSPFSAKAQQKVWLQHNELPSYKHAFSAFLYYFVTSLHNIGPYIFLCVILGTIIFFFNQKIRNKFYVFFLLFFPFVFYWTALFLGQAVIFIPDLTPLTYQWRLFNVRYGVMMIPFAAFFFSYLFFIFNKPLKVLLTGVLIVQLALFSLGIESVITYQDGAKGLSAAKNVDATQWMKKHYDHGLVLLDDYARTLSIIKSGLPIDRVIYIGNKPYWDDALHTPQKYATWVILQKHDAVWTALYQNPATRGNLYKYYHKVYTSPDILIFEKSSDSAFQ